jgi:hypothetical protein
VGYPASIALSTIRTTTASLEYRLTILRPKRLEPRGGQRALYTWYTLSIDIERLSVTLSPYCEEKEGMLGRD